MVSNPIPDELKSTHLFLLVGTNPLPDWMASRLLVRDGAQLYLVHSERTFRIAEQLAKYLMNNCHYRQPVYVKVDNPYKAGDVYSAVAKKLKDITSGTVGLNYTGGTKIMATHSFRAIEQKVPERSTACRL